MWPDINDKSSSIKLNNGVNDYEFFNLSSLILYTINEKYIKIIEYKQHNEDINKLLLTSLIRTFCRKKLKK